MKFARLVRTTSGDALGRNKTLVAAHSASTGRGWGPVANYMAVEIAKTLLYFARGLIAGILPPIGLNQLEYVWIDVPHIVG